MILIGLLGILHLGFMYLEMFAPKALQAKSFGMPLAFVTQLNAQVALKNQGIYNGALGVVLLLSLWLLSGSGQIATLRLLAGFVIVVGVYGGATVTKKIYGLQALPGALALISLFF
ncbi:hypothetical protein FC83_GL000443 [Agrilactobacillus composti DSM 18527 = JCM 14202]|uniref:Integral membrane protein n=2 Tax=Agrilactobacillus TaxID=2767875 RepID=A0A0R1XQN5_9LACO|nr:hypothetical protein FC83_GL000443 [Agrilactobacillus composti DSM 18527 = JCM 14202]